MAATTTTRVVRFCVDTKGLRQAQRDLLDRHAEAAHWAWNWGLGLRNANHDELMTHVHEQSILEATGDVHAAKILVADKGWWTDARNAAPDHLRKALSAYTLGVMFTAYKRADPWGSTRFPGVNRYAVTGALQDLDAGFARYYRDGGAKSHFAYTCQDQRSRSRHMGRAQTNILDATCPARH